MIHDPAGPTPEPASAVDSHTAYKYRLYPSPEAAGLLARYAGAERAIYNRAVQRQRELREVSARSEQLDGPLPRDGGELTYRDVSEWAATEAPWLREIPGNVRGQAVRIARRALVDSFRLEDRKAPTFRPRRGGTHGFSWQAVLAVGEVRKISKRWHEVRLPTCQGAAAVWCRVRVDADRQPPAAAYRAGKVLRVTRDAAGTWWLTMNDAAEAQPTAPEASSCGLDLGVVCTLTLADDAGGVLRLNLPRLLSREESRRLRRLQQAQNRARRTIPCRGPCGHDPGGCWKTSTRYRKRRREIAVLRRTERRRAGDWIERVTTRIADRYQLVGVENLKVRAMTASAAGTIEAPGRNVAAKRGLNRVILQQRWGTIVRRLDEKVAARGGQLVRVPAPNTSRRCHPCGHTSAANRETRAVFRCEACGHTDCADANAARNIHQLALQGHPPARGGPATERASAAVTATDVEDRHWAADEASITPAA